MKFNIVRTNKFNDQLTDIVMYLVNAFGKKKAIDYLNYLEENINTLSSYPEMGVIPRYQAISKQGYRALVCKQNIIFYKINEADKQIILYIIVSAKRNYLNLL